MFILAFLLRFLEVLILVRVILSWIPAWQRTTAGRLIIVVTEPVLAPLRAALPGARAGGVGLDFSPMLALLIVFMLRRLLNL